MNEQAAETIPSCNREKAIQACFRLLSTKEKPLLYFHENDEVERILCLAKALQSNPRASWLKIRVSEGCDLGAEKFLPLLKTLASLPILEHVEVVGEWAGCSLEPIFDALVENSSIETLTLGSPFNTGGSFVSRGFVVDMMRRLFPMNSSTSIHTLIVAQLPMKNEEPEIRKRLPALLDGEPLSLGKLVFLGRTNPQFLSAISSFSYFRLRAVEIRSSSEFGFDTALRLCTLLTRAPSLSQVTFGPVSPSKDPSKARRGDRIIEHWRTIWDRTELILKYSTGRRENSLVLVKKNDPQQQRGSIQARPLCVLKRKAYTKFVNTFAASSNVPKKNETPPQPQESKVVNIMSSRIKEKIEPDDMISKEEEDNWQFVDHAVSIVVKEQVSVTLNLDGTASINQRGRLACKAFREPGDSFVMEVPYPQYSKFRFVNHPKIDKKVLAKERKLTIKNGKRFPLNRFIDLLRWRCIQKDVVVEKVSGEKGIEDDSGWLTVSQDFQEEKAGWMNLTGNKDKPLLLPLEIDCCHQIAKDGSEIALTVRLSCFRSDLDLVNFDMGFSSNPLLWKPRVLECWSGVAGHDASQGNFHWHIRKLTRGQHILRVLIYPSSPVFNANICWQASFESKEEELCPGIRVASVRSSNDGSEISSSVSRSPVEFTLNGISTLQ